MYGRVYDTNKVEELFEMEIKKILSGSVCVADRFTSDYAELSRIREILRQMGYTVSMTQGVWDFIHPGHLNYLNETKKRGDITIIAVDTDEYVGIRKSTPNERRPVVPMVDRLQILSNLRTVDIIVSRDIADHKDDPYAVIKVVRPDVLVMSRSTKDVTEKDYEALREFCGKVDVLDPQADTSTTARLRELLIDGAAGLADHLVRSIGDYFHQKGRPISIGQKEGKG